MASKRIQGITIEIDGNTQKLNSALKDVDRQLSSTQSQLKDVEKLLKLDPKNTELLSQKQKLLGDAIGSTKDRLAQLEKAQAELSKRDSTPEVQKQQEALQREILATKKQLEGFGDELGKIPNKATLAFESIGDGLDKAGKKMTEVGTSMTTYVTAPIAAAGAAAVAAFGEVDDAMDTVIKKTGASGVALEDMQKRVENLATTIPTDFDTAANAIGEINTRFGLTGDALEDLSAKFIKFADLNATDVSSSVDKTQKLMAAFGIEAKDAGKVLDVLNSTGQKTGINLDTLTDLLTKNAAQLQDMGMNAASAADFLGMVEMSGADVSSVMKGLQTAYKKAAKEGKPMNQVLKEFSASMKSNKSDTEKTQEAIELFGSKAGPAIKKALDDGTISLDSMAASLNDVAGNVEKTFEGTLDGVDNWKMAMNEVKLIGADIGGILSEIAGPILTKVRDALARARNAWKGLSDDQQENIIKIAGIVAALGPALTLIGKVTTAVGALSHGFGVLAAHPVAAAILGVTAALGGAAIALKNHTDKVREAYEEEIGLTKEVKSLNEAIKEQNEAYQEAVDRKNETVDATQAEYDHLQELAEEYDGYLQKNGELTDKEKERAAFIENELCTALGIERDELQKIIDKNGELSTSISEIIEKRRAQAVLNKLESEYTEALVKTEEAETNLLAAENAREQQKKKIDGLEKQRLEVQRKLAAITNEQGEALSGLEGVAQEYRDELLELDQKIADSTAVMNVMDEAVAQAEETYEGYQTTIRNYEGLSAAIIEGDTQKIGKSMAAFRNDFKTTETASTESLKRQVTTLETEYRNMKAAVERGDKGITEADLREKEYWLRQARNEYNKATADVREAARSQTDTYATQIAAGKSRAQEGTRTVTGGVKTVLDGARYDAEKSGTSFVDGFVNKILAGYYRAQNAGRQLGGAAANALNSRLTINSPSKVTAESGKWFTEGFALGIEKNAQDAVKAAAGMADSSAGALNQQAQAAVVSANPYADTSLVGAFRSAMSGMRVMLDDEVAGAFVEDTVTRAIYAI